MLAAVRELYPDAQITVDHAVTMYGLLCEVRGRSTFTSSEVKQIETRMREIVDQDDADCQNSSPPRGGDRYL